jgi:hypothetical protein
MRIFRVLVLSCFASILCVGLLSSPVNADVITQCGESSGYAAWLSNGILGDQGNILGPQGNFVEDGFSGSQIVLEAIQDPDSGEIAVDVVFWNSGTPYRASEDGSVYLANFNTTNNTWMVLAVAATWIDTYLFYLDDSGNGEVVWTNSRSGSAPKAVLMRARCG